MPIAESVLRSAGARLEEFAPRQVIFAEGQPAINYYQLAEGIVKMVNVGEEADFIQGVFFPGESFGEPPLFGDFPYPATALTMRRGRVWVLPKASFVTLMTTQPVYHFELSRVMSRRLLRKTEYLRTQKQATASEHCMQLLHQLSGRLQLLQPESASSGLLLVPFTRQELADMLGLRVETVIRALAQLAKQHAVVIENHRLYLPLPQAESHT